MNQIQNMQDFNSVKLKPPWKDVKTLCEYIWIDGDMILRSKTKIYSKTITELSELEWWAFDGSACHQADDDNDEITLKPIFMCQDPFRQGEHKLVLCETYGQDRVTPAKNNFRHLAAKIMEECKDSLPQFGFEQEYFMVQKTHLNEWPLGWPNGCIPPQKDIYYCSVGSFVSIGRALAETHMRLCVNAGLKIAGINQEFAPSQWEFQIGICDGIELSDQTWMARYILQRAGESFGVDINYKPKNFDEDHYSSGGHMNFSLNQTRTDGGFKYMTDKLMPLLEEAHTKTMPLYGEGNTARLVGKATSAYDKFSFKIGKRRQASVRIPIQAQQEGKGYFEDRRPAANIDPYLVTAALVDICCLDSKYLNDLNREYQESKRK